MTEERDGAAPAEPSDEGPELTGLGSLASAHGALTTGRGLLSGVVGFALAVMSLLGVIGFHFPAYLSTPEFRAVYDVTLARSAYRRSNSSAISRTCALTLVLVF